MSLLKEINDNVSHAEARDLVVEDVESLTPAEMGKLVRYVIDQQKNGSNEDAGELAGQALENIPGMESASEKEISSVIATVERAVKMQSDGAAHRATKNNKT